MEAAIPCKVRKNKYRETCSESDALKIALLGRGAIRWVIAVLCASSSLCLDKMKIPEATATVDKEWQKLEKMPACVDVKSVTVIRMTVARQSLNKAYSVSHQNERKKLRRHKLKSPWDKQTRVHMKTWQKDTVWEKQEGTHDRCRRHTTNTTNVCAQLLTAS